jgi:hypothetical protein
LPRRRVPLEVFAPCLRPWANTPGIGGGAKTPNGPWGHDNTLRHHPAIAGEMWGSWLAMPETLGGRQIGRSGLLAGRSETLD